MKILLSWLNEYVDTGADLDALEATLAMLGLPVEDVIRTGGVEGVVTARVLRTEVPPDAAKVQRVWIDTGDGTEHHVWCGAFNFGVGDVVPFAPSARRFPTAGRWPAGRSSASIRRGCCAPLASWSSATTTRGILVLPGDAPIGVPYGDAIGQRDDVVLDLEVARNRPDAWCYIGVARDLAAKSGTELRVPGPPPIVAGGGELRTTVEIVDGDRCGRFTSTVLSGVRIGPSATVDGRAPARSRDASDQQRRRRQQLRDARRRAAQPSVRPRHLGRSWLPDPPGPGRRDVGDPRRRRATAHRRRPPDL